jgi:glyoxylase-like metal-dependent hydrolase (beta-lactamase superfamily II)
MTVYNENDLIIEKFVFNPFSENTYVVWDNLTREGLIVDPGCYLKTEQEELKNYITQNSIIVKFIINTHGHIDHILGNEFCKREFNAKLVYAEQEQPLINSAKDQAILFQVDFQPSPAADLFMTEETSLTIGKHEATFLFTPGHTAFEYCILFKEQNVCFTGDVLFKESIGRTDLWGGNLDTLMNSIITKLFALNENVAIFPGHAQSSTIGNEKRHNPFFF